MKPLNLPEPKDKRCVVCGSAHKLEGNHPGGRHYLPSFVQPYCEEDHKQFHFAVRQAGIDLRRADNPLMRFVRAMKVLLVAAWQLLDQLEREIQPKGNEL